jgi:hypothetical protein
MSSRGSDRAAWEEWREMLWTLFRWFLATAFVLYVPLAAWAKSSGPGNIDAFTPAGWVAEHVWVGFLAACVAAFAGCAWLRGESGIGVAGLLLAWPWLAWAVGSQYTRYALTHAGWTAEAVWLGVLAAVIVVRALLAILRW